MLGAAKHGGWFTCFDLRIGDTSCSVLIAICTCNNLSSFLKLSSLVRVLRLKPIAFKSFDALLSCLLIGSNLSRLVLDNTTEPNRPLAVDAFKRFKLNLCYLLIN